MLRVADILQEKDTRIITVRLRETVTTAAMLMKRENIGALVVKDVCRTEGNVVVGVFSERDVVQAIATHGPAALEMPVSRLLARPLTACSQHDTIEEVAGLMTEHHVRLLPVQRTHAYWRDQHQRRHPVFAEMRNRDPGSTPHERGCVELQWRCDARLSWRRSITNLWIYKYQLPLGGIAHELSRSANSKVVG